MFVTDSLFSLEFTVSKLTITPGVICRFPAVAFRFLDFPTIFLHLLDEAQRDRLRTKLTIDPHYEIPDQFKEYQDRSGYYDFSCGKSCLYRIPPDTLKALLAQVPLYIIVADGFTPTPTLVGSAILPLQEVMDDVYELLLKDGVSVPASSGVKSSLTVYNLMGHAIGQVIVGCRLTSLGMALLTHLPESSVSSLHHYQPGVYMPSLNVQPPEIIPQAKKPTSEEERNISIALLDVANTKGEQDYPITHIDKPTQKSSPAKTEQETQTQKKDRYPNKSKGVQEQPQDIVDEGIELVVPDIYCPPPLYYNKLSRPQPTVPYHPSSTESDESTSQQTEENTKKDKKRKEAWTSEFGKPLTDHVNVPEHLQLPQAQRKENREGLPPDLSYILKSMSASASGKLSHDGFPLLRALMTELFRVGVNAAGTQGSHVDPPPADQPKVTSTPLKRSPRKSSPLRSREMSPLSPKPRSLVHSPDIYRPHSSSPTLSKPPSRPGSRQASKKGPLIFGYTNTQKLRLSKTNPELLRKIQESENQIKQKKERERIGLLQLQGGDMVDHGIPHSHNRKQTGIKLNIPKGRRRDGPRSYRSYTSQQPLDISTEMGRLTTELAEVKRELADQKAQFGTPRFDPSVGDLTLQPGYNVELGVTRVINPSVGRVVSPKPSQQTPRRSMSAMSNRNSRDADLSTLHEQSFQSDSRRSLEIHLPTPALEEGHEHQPNSSASGSQSQHKYTEETSPRSQYTESSYHTGRDEVTPRSQRGNNSPHRSSPGGHDDEEYTMTFSPVGGENTSELASPLGLYRDSYGSESFESEN